MPRSRPQPALPGSTTNRKPTDEGPEIQMVGVAGFEPTTSSSRTKRATKLRHTPVRPPSSSRNRVSIAELGSGPEIGAGDEGQQ